MAENRFNLIDEAWIPVVGHGKVSLRAVFADENLKQLGGNPLEHIAVFKLLLAIAQSAYTPEDDEEWEELGKDGLQQKILTYLDAHYDDFWLYGDKPFLQMPVVDKAAIQPFGAVRFEIATGNTTVVTEQQKKDDYSDADRAMIVLLMMGMAAGGKKVDKTVVLSSGCEKGTAKPGTNLGSCGYLHSYIRLDNIMETLYFNLFSKNGIDSLGMFKNGIGVAPWEQMPAGEKDAIAESLKESYLGRLVPVSRFVLIADNGLHYTDGILHDDYNLYKIDPTVAANVSGKKTKVLWAHSDKRPWREITSILGFMNKNPGKDGSFICNQLRLIYEIERKEYCAKRTFNVWSGGVQTSSNAGEQYLTGTDDYVESQVELSGHILGSSYYAVLESQMKLLDSFSKNLYACVLGYHKELMMDGKNIAGQATDKYWQLTEQLFPKINEACMIDDDSDKCKEELKKYNKVVWGIINKLYDEFCPMETARQIEAWSKNRPVNKENKDG